MIRRILAAAVVCVALGTGATRAQTLTHRIDTMSGWGGAVNGFQRVGNIGYCGSGQRLVVLDISNEATIHEIGSVNLEGTVEDLVVRGDYVYVILETRFPYSMATVNIATPSAPRMVSVAPFPPATNQISSPRLLRLYGDLLYVMAGHSNGGVQAWSLADPARPAAQCAPECAVPFLAPSGPIPVFDMAIQGHLVYVATDYGLQVYDLEPNPLHPVYVGGVGLTTCPDPVTCVSVEGNRALVQVRDFCRPAGHQYFARFVDVSNPASPVLLGAEYDQFVVATRSVLYGNYALVADWVAPNPCGISLNEKGLAVLDFLESVGARAGGYLSHELQLNPRSARAGGPRVPVL